MFNLKFKYKILFAIFFILILTSLWPKNIYLLVLFSLFTYIFLPIKKYWDGICVGLLLFSIFYTIMVVISGQVESGFLTIAYLMSPIAFYRFGRFLISEYREENERFILLLIIVFTYLLYVFVLTVVDMSVVGIVNSERTLLGTSTQDDALSATLYGLMTSVGIGCIGACFAKGQKLLVRLFYSILVILSLLTVVHLVNRGGLVILIMCLATSLLINYQRSVVKLVLVIIALAIGAFLLLEFGLLNSEVLEAYEERNAAGGYGVETAGGRTELWLMAIENLVRNPMGWQQKSYAHNLWLDIAKIGGWISLLPFLIVTISFVGKLISLFRKSGTTFASTIVVLNLGMFLAAFIEPVIEGSMLFFCMLMFVWGITISVEKELRK